MWAAPLSKPNQNYSPDPDEWRPWKSILRWLVSSLTCWCSCPSTQLALTQLLPAIFVIGSRAHSALKTNPNSKQDAAARCFRPFLKRVVRSAVTNKSLSKCRTVLFDKIRDKARARSCDWYGVLVAPVHLEISAASDIHQLTAHLLSYYRSESMEPLLGISWQDRSWHGYYGSRDLSVSIHG